MLSFLRRRSTTNKNLDQQLVFQLSKSRIPSPRQLKYLSHFIKGKERWALYICLGLMIGGLAWLGTVFYRQHIELVPKAGGRYIEGVVGNPQYVNPLYASFNNVDNDLERLIFSRLFTVDNEGKTVPDLAAGYDLAADQKSYTIYLREASWSDGSAVTADDVIFTFNLIQDPDYRSPLRTRFSGITAEKKDDQTVVFTLKEAYGQFTSLLDFGILPNALWQGVSPEMMPLAELNLKPLGSGAYQLKSLIKNNTGTVRSYTLERNPHYYGQAPYLDEIVFKFFPSPEEMISTLNKGQLNGIAQLPLDLKETVIAKNSLNYQSLIQPHLTALFFNMSSKGAISEAAVRKALAGVQRSAIISATAYQQEAPAYSILMPHQPGYSAQAETSPETARKLLDDAGWKLRTLNEGDVENAKAAKNAKDAGNIVTLGAGTWSMKENQGLAVTLTAPSALKSVAEKVAEQWKQLGIKTNLSIKEDEAIQNEALSNHQFEILLYTEALDNGDPYPFWSTGAPGNLSQYSNKQVDTWLTEARLSADTAAIAERYQKFQTAVATDVPVIPLYWGTYVYPQTKKLKGQSLSFVKTPADRLAGFSNWYFKVKRQLK